MSHRSASLSLSAIRLPRSTAFEKAASKVSASSVMLSAALHRCPSIGQSSRPAPGPARTAAALPTTLRRRRHRRLRGRPSALCDAGHGSAAASRAHHALANPHPPVAAYVACKTPMSESSPVRRPVTSAAPSARVAGACAARGWGSAGACGLGLAAVAAVLVARRELATRTTARGPRGGSQHAERARAARQQRQRGAREAARLRPRGR